MVGWVSAPSLPAELRKALAACRVEASSPTWSFADGTCTNSSTRRAAAIAPFRRSRAADQGGAHAPRARGRSRSSGSRSALARRPPSSAARGGRLPPAPAALCPTGAAAILPRVIPLGGPSGAQRPHSPPRRRSGVCRTGRPQQSLAFDIDYVAGYLTGVSVFWITVVIGVVLLVAGVVAIWLARIRLWSRRSASSRRNCRAPTSGCAPPRRAVPPRPRSRRHAPRSPRHRRSARAGTPTGLVTDRAPDAATRDHEVTDAETSSPSEFRTARRSRPAAADRPAADAAAGEAVLDAPTADPVAEEVATAAAAAPPGDDAPSPAVS